MQISDESNTAEGRVLIEGVAIEEGGEQVEEVGEGKPDSCAGRYNTEGICDDEYGKEDGEWE